MNGPYVATGVMRISRGTNQYLGLSLRSKSCIFGKTVFALVEVRCLAARVMRQVCDSRLENKSLYRLSTVAGCPGVVARRLARLQHSRPWAG